MSRGNGTPVEQPKPHVCNFQRVNGSPSSGSFLDAEGKQHCYKTTPWEEKCSCGASNGNNGEDTVPVGC